jgi:hypothetical protein
MESWVLASYVLGNLSQRVQSWKVQCLVTDFWSAPSSLAEHLTIVKPKDSINQRLVRPELSGVLAGNHKPQDLDGGLILKLWAWL